MEKLLSRRLLFGGPIASSACFAPPVLAQSVARQRLRVGVYCGAGCTGAPRVAEFEHWLGREIDIVLEFIDPPGGWDAMLDTADWTSGCWRKTRYSVVFTVPMLMPSQPHVPGLSLQQGAAGDYDVQFRRLAERLVASGYASAILRLGIEFNGNWFGWSAQHDPQAYIAYWRRIVAVMRSTLGARFRFDWNPNVAVGPSPAFAYPGDDVVDLIGLDVYNEIIPGIEDPERRWRYLLDHPSGLRWHRDFAEAHRKPRSFPEWGTGTQQDGQGAGDDAIFVRNMLDWMREGDSVEYMCYWNFRSPEYDAKVTDGKLPQAAAALRAGLRA